MSPAATLYAVPKSRLRHSHRGRKSDRQRRKFGELAALVRRLPCCVEGCERGPSEAAHVKSRGAGGEAWIEVGGVEVGNLVPLCHAHHRGGDGVLHPQHTVGVRGFERAYSLVLRLPDRGPTSLGTLAEIAVVIGWWARRTPGGVAP